MRKIKLQQSNLLIRSENVNGDVVSIIKRIATNLSELDMERNFPLEDWKTLTLHSGLPGLALLYGEMQNAFPDEGWDDIGNRCLNWVAKSIETQGIASLSMFSGAAGIGLSVVSLSESFKYYRKLIANINSVIFGQLGSLLKLDTRNGVGMQIYDVIEGVTGILSYLLLFNSDYEARRVLEEGLQFLVRLSIDDIVIDGALVPGWYIPSEYQFSELEKEVFPNGNFNTSMSHGISGPLGLLSNALLQGVEVPNQAQAIRRLTNFLKWGMLKDNTRVFWKGQISFEEFVSQKICKENVVRRDAWCYGGPGICYAMTRAAAALGDHDMLQESQHIFRETVHDLKGIFSPTFCHGYAGIYQVIQAMQISGEESYQQELGECKDKIISFYDSKNLFGFDDIESDGARLKPQQSIGLLTGTTGTCLSLLSGEVGPENMLWTKAFQL